MDTKGRISSDHFFIVEQLGTIYCLRFLKAPYIGTHIGQARKQN
jgi:hypothetical protein